MAYTVVLGAIIESLDISLIRVNDFISETDDAQFDEPVRETIMRDLREVAHKFRHVIAPQLLGPKFSTLFFIKIGSKM